MNEMKKLPIILATLAALTFPAVQAADVPGRCKVHNWSPGDIIEVEAQLYKQTHISLPEDALDVVWGPKELWNQDFIKRSVFITPRTNQPEGAETTATAIGNSGNAYEFRVVRVSKMMSHCVIIKTGGSLVNRANWDSRDDSRQAQITALQQQLVRAQADQVTAAAEVKRQTSAAVKSYRAALASNYDWTEGQGYFAKTTVESVQDDGRFTYIRLSNDNNGIMSVSAEIDGEQETIEKVYDASKREYRIAGVYPKFILRAGKSELTITRRSK